MSGEGGIVVKLGGSVLPRLAPHWWDDVVAFAPGLVFVHGWSAPLRQHQQRTGVDPVFLTNQHGHRSRLTDERVIDDIGVVAAGLRALIAQRLADRGLTAVAVDGADSGLLHADIRLQRWWVDGALRKLENLVGPVRAVDGAVLGELRAGSDALIVSPLATSITHPRVNTDADRAAVALAIATGAHHLVLVTDVAGVLVGDRPLSSVSTVDVNISGGMRKKVRAALVAAQAGVRVVIGSAPVGDLLAGRAGTEVVSG